MPRHGSLARQLQDAIEFALTSVSFSRTQGPEYQPLARLGEPLGEGNGGEDPTEDEPHHRPQPVHLDLDTGAQLVAAGSDLHVEAGDEDIKRVRNKIDWHILPLMCSGCFSMSHSIAVALCPHPQLQFWLTTPAALYWIQFMDKTTLGSAAILGIRYSCPVVVRQLCQGLNHTHIGRQPISQQISKYCYICHPIECSYGRANRNNMYGSQL